MSLKQFIARMPKAELHVHLEGTLEPELRFELAQRNGIELPYRDRKSMIDSYTFNDLPSFLAVYYAAMDVLRTEDDFYDLTLAYLQRAHTDNIVYAELFFDPQAHTRRGVSFEAVIRGIHCAQLEAERSLGIKTQLILCFLRDLSAESAAEHLELAKPYLDWIVGVGLDSDEQDNPPLKFGQVFENARQMGLKMTMHCDVNQDDTLNHIGQCLDFIRVDRIDHGVNVLDDHPLTNTVRRRKLGLTVCPVSNLFVVQSLTSDEIRDMLEKGLKATINSDDPAYFRAYLNENFDALIDSAEFSRDELVTLVRNAFEVAWLPDTEKADYQALVDDYLIANPA